MLQLCSAFRPQLLLPPRQFRFTDGILIRFVSLFPEIVSLILVLPIASSVLEFKVPNKPIDLIFFVTAK